MLKKILTPLLLLSAVLLNAQRQTPYEIKFTVKGAKDSVLYLAIYTFDKTPIVDTSFRSKDGSYTFKKDRELDKGMYILASEKKEKYLDFVINETDRFSVSFSPEDIIKTIRFSNSEENNRFMELVRFMSDKTKAFASLKAKVKKKSLADSTKILSAKNEELSAEIKKFRKDFLVKYPEGFVSDFVRLQIEPDVSNPPKAGNGRPDSIWQYQAFKNTYWKNIPLEDERMLHTPIFADKLKNYFSKYIYQVPDSISKEIPKVMRRLKPAKSSFMWSLSWITQEYENHALKYIDFESVFVCIVDSFYETGQVDFYTPEQLKKIIARKNVLKPLLIGKIVPDLFAVDTNGMKVCLRLKLDTCKTSGCLTKIYEANTLELNRQLISLHSVKADYTVLVFWDIDCGHCKKDIPVLFEKFRELKADGINVKVQAVYDETNFTKWPKSIREMKLLDPDWNNVADGVHLQDFHQKFDIYSNPVIYILDKNKVIRYKRIGADQVDDAIHNLEEIRKMKKPD